MVIADVATLDYIQTILAEGRGERNHQISCRYNAALNPAHTRARWLNGFCLRLGKILGARHKSEAGNHLHMFVVEVIRRFLAGNPSVLARTLRRCR